MESYPEIRHLTAGPQRSTPNHPNHPRGQSIDIRDVRIFILIHIYLPVLSFSITHSLSLSLSLSMYIYMNDYYIYLPILTRSPSSHILAGTEITRITLYTQVPHILAGNELRRGVRNRVSLVKCETVIRKINLPKHDDVLGYRNNLDLYTKTKESYIGDEQVHRDHIIECQILNRAFCTSSKQPLKLLKNYLEKLVENCVNTRISSVLFVLVYV